VDWSQSTSHAATAERLRSDAATTCAPAPDSRALIVDPLGDGRTRSVSPGAARIEAGDRLTPPSVREADRGTARVAPRWCAKARAESSCHRYG
jgi:hypothetical protein